MAARASDAQVRFRRRPFGIVLIALYTALSALTALPVACTGIFVSASPRAPLMLAIMTLVLGLLALVSFASAYGLWTLQPWGRRLTQVLYAVSIPLALLSMFGVYPDHPVNFGNLVYQTLAIVVEVAVLIYLASEPIRALYRGAAEGRT